MDGLKTLNEAPLEAAVESLHHCCGSARWVEGMLAGRPFQAEADLFLAAEEVWRGLGPEDWREAFRHHPRIGDKAALRARFAGAKGWAAGEQAKVKEADEGVLDALAEGNRAYEERFGHIFIVCATGKSAEEMLALLRGRLDNDPETELRVAAAEQAKITRLRLEKLLRP